MKPIIYESDIAVRFSELDPYGHVNTKHYLDYIIQSRWDAMERLFPGAMAKMLEASVGFFVSKVEINFIRPIKGCQKIDVSSFVSELKESRANIIFEVKDANKKIVSKGNFVCFCVDIANNGKPQSPEDWVKEYFFSDL